MRKFIWRGHDLFTEAEESVSLTWKFIHPLLKKYAIGIGLCLCFAV
jgi:hypothetical protein